MASDGLEEKKDERIGNGIGDNTALSWPFGHCKVAGEQECIISKEDKSIIRELAKKVANIASGLEQEEKKKLWMELNSLQETRPLIFTDPEKAWYEIIRADELKCTGNLARVWEFKLLKEIYWAEKIKDDRVIEPVFKVYYIHEKSGRGLEPQFKGGDKGGSFTWEAPLREFDDVEKMHFQEITVNYEKTKKLFALAEETLGDVLEVRLEGTWWWSLGMTYDLIYLRGFERMLLDMYDNPEGLHKVMSFLCDENIAMLDFLESNGLLSLNNGGDFIGTGSYGWCDELPSADFDGEKVTTHDMWGYCESQETANVSPEFFKEFVFPYQLCILERFGLNIYGCCEPLDKRIDIVKSIPRLRRVTVSPWSNTKIMAEELGKDYIFSKKVNPADIATPKINQEYIRIGLREVIETAAENSCRVELIMRDIVTLSNKPENIIKWVQIVREEIERVY